jgi:hypothetical protein
VRLAAKDRNAWANREPQCFCRRCGGIVQGFGRQRKKVLIFVLLGDNLTNPAKREAHTFAAW